MNQAVSCILLVALGFAPIAGARAEEAIAAQRAEIKKIREEGKAAENSKRLLDLLRETKSDLVALDCAVALREVNKPEVQRELLTIAKDKNASSNAQDYAVYALIPFAAALSADDITALLDVRKDLNTSMHCTVLTELAPAVQLSKSNVETILQGFSHAKAHQKIFFVQFAGKFLQSHRRDDPAVAEAWAASENFITSAALPAVKSTPQLRNPVASALAAQHSKAAVPLLMDFMSDEWARHQKGDKVTFDNIVKDLDKVLETTRGYDEKLRFDDPANLKAVEGWLAWWKEHKGDAEFQAQ